MSKVKMTMVCEEEQIKLIMKALEEYERLRICQADMLAESIAWDGVKIDWNNEHDGYVRNAELTEHLRRTIEEAIRYGLQFTGKERKAKTAEVRSIEDLWMGIRYRMFRDLLTAEEQANREWMVDSREPLGYGEYPLADIKIEKVEE